MEEQTEADLFLRHPFFVDLIITRMLKVLKNPVEKFIFTYVLILGYKQKDAAEVLFVNETNISRHVKNITKKLKRFSSSEKKSD